MTLGIQFNLRDFMVDVIFEITTNDPCPADNATCQGLDRDTWYSWTDLPIKSVLVGTHVSCLLRDGKLFFLLSCTRRLKAKLVPR